MLRELADGVYVENRFHGGNVALIRCEGGDLLVDTPMLPPEARQWQLALMQMGVKDPYAIVNTDYHPEHFLGNAQFMPTRVIGHELSAKPIAKYKTSTLERLSNTFRESDRFLADEILNTEIRPPEIAVGDRLTLHLGRRVEVLYLEGHTPASVGVYLPKERMLFAGDTITNDEHPTMYQCVALAWLVTLTRINGMEIDTIVPGVGEPCGKEVIDPLRAYILEMHSRTLELFKKGASRRECVDKVDMLDWFPVPEDQATAIRHRRRESVERVYTEIRLALR